MINIITVVLAEPIPLCYSLKQWFSFIIMLLFKKNWQPPRWEHPTIWEALV